MPTAVTVGRRSTTWRPAPPARSTSTATWSPLVRIGDDVYAIGDTCSHANVSLSEGEVLADDREIECWKHGSTFSLLTGEPQTLPATQPVPVYEAGGTARSSVVHERAKRAPVGACRRSGGARSPLHA